MKQSSTLIYVQDQDITKKIDTDHILFKTQIVSTLSKQELHCNNKQKKSYSRS